VLLALFPFDFAVSIEELSAKLRSDHFGWLIAGDLGFRRLASLTAEVVAIAPLGVLIGLLARRIDLLRVFIAGLLLGLVLEGLQLLILSSVTQGLSVIARGIGLTLGVFIGHYLNRNGLVAASLWVRRLALPLMIPYFAVLAAMAGWFSNQTLGLSDGLERFDLIQLIPFYFHYFSTEPAAMASLLSNVTVYAPLGIVVWSKHFMESGLQQRTPREPILVALFVSSLFETSKLWLVDKHPDYTNTLIAIAAAWGTYHLVSWLGLARREVRSAHIGVTTIGVDQQFSPHSHRNRLSKIFLG
jgi:glycopeptide antibiotics resistance protein